MTYKCIKLLKGSWVHLGLDFVFEDLLLWSTKKTEKYRTEIMGSPITNESNIKKCLQASIWMDELKQKHLFHL